MRSSRLNVHPAPHTLSVPAPFLGGVSPTLSLTCTSTRADGLYVLRTVTGMCVACGSAGTTRAGCLQVSRQGLDEDQRPQSASRRARVCVRRLARASGPDHTHTLWWNCYHLHIRLLKSVQNRCGRSHPRLALMSPSFHPTQEAPHLGPFAGSSRAYLLPAGRRGREDGARRSRRVRVNFISGQMYEDIQKP